MALKHGILGLLNYGDMTGYDLMKTFEKSLYYFWHVKTSQIYLELDNMAKSGLVVFRKEIQKNRPNKNIFMITENGKEELKKWLSQYDIKKSFNMKNEFLMVVFFLRLNFTIPAASSKSSRLSSGLPLKILSICPCPIIE